MENQEERLRQETLAVARQKAEHILARAASEQEKALRQCREELEEKRQSRLAEIRQEAARQARSIHNSISMEMRRRWLNKREEAILDFFQVVLRQTEECSGERRRESLCFLAEEALQALSGGEFQVACAVADTDLVTADWLQERARAALGEEGEKCSFSISPEQKLRGGLRFQTRSRRLSFDNTYQSRLNDLRDALRRKLAEE